MRIFRITHIPQWEVYMSRARHSTQDEQNDTRDNIALTSVIAVSVSDYLHMKKLPGTKKDLEMVEEIFATNKEIGLYESRFKKLHNPTSGDLRKEITNFSNSRSARGDILIFYFSGHGAILGNEFAFCLQDTQYGVDEDKIFSLSAIRFIDVVQTLSASDVFPVFIIDACFSGNSAPQGTVSITSQMHDFLRTYFAGSYALLASTNLDSLSFENIFGGFFTRSLHKVSTNGLADIKGRHLPFLTLEALSAPLQDALAKNGHPLSKCYIGADLPSIAVARNKKYSPDRERFAPYFKRIVEYAWNKGKPRSISRDDLLKEIGRGAYANHSKLDRQPWGLLKDVKNNSNRALTERGIKFAKGELEIPSAIIRNSATWEWIADPDCKMVSIKDIQTRQKRNKS